MSSPWDPAILDLFANAKNRRLERYVSPCRDEQAEAQNALECSWPEVVTVCILSFVSSVTSPSLCVSENLTHASGSTGDI